MSETALHTPFPTGSPWLTRALAVSTVLHALAVVALVIGYHPAKQRETEVVDIELAPAPPKAEALPEEIENAKGVVGQLAAADIPKDEPKEESDVPVDAGVDAPPKKKPVDAQEVIAEADAGEGDAAVEVAAVEGSGSAQTGSGSGSAMETEQAVEGAPSTAGTAANLLTYFPPGHLVTMLIRFDRLRGTEWAAPTEKLLRPMPDYHGLFGDREASIGDKLDTLVISSPRPKDATATTLVAHTQMSRREMRDFLANPDVPIAWTAAKGGMLGKRSGKLFPNDRRVVLSPWKNWFVLAQPEDLGALAGAAKGNLEAIEARPKVVPWLDTLRDIEKESGEEKRGPALVVTLTSTKQRYQFPDVGVGVTSVATPERVSIAVELVKQGWLVRGNIKFGSEADAAEFERAVKTAQQHVADSHVLAALLRKQHVLDVVKGLSLSRGGDRVSYGTSISIVDARAVLAAAAALLDEYFAKPP